MTHITSEQLRTIVPMTIEGDISVNVEELRSLLERRLEQPDLELAISRVDYLGKAPTLSRIVDGICWWSRGDNRALVWSFRVDALRLDIISEGDQLCPISEDPDLITRAVGAVANYTGGQVNQRGRIEVPNGDGTAKQVRVVVVHSDRVVRPEDCLSGVELLAWNAGRLGVALLFPLGEGKALIRMMEC